MKFYTAETNIIQSHCNRKEVALTGGTERETSSRDDVRCAQQLGKPAAGSVRQAGQRAAAIS